MSAATDPLVVYALGDGSSVVLRGRAPDPEFDCWPGHVFEDIGLAPPSGGLWVWVEEGSTFSDDGGEAWLGEWRRPTAAEVTAIAEDRWTP